MGSTKQSRAAVHHHGIILQHKVCVDNFPKIETGACVHGASENIFHPGLLLRGFVAQKQQFVKASEAACPNNTVGNNRLSHTYFSFTFRMHRVLLIMSF